MLTRMTTTAWAHGSWNAMVLGVPMLMVWALFAAVISVGLDQPIGRSFGFAMVAIWPVLFVAFLIGVWRGRRRRGGMLLDCGPQPARALMLFNASIFALFTLIGAFGDVYGVLGSAFGVSLMIFFLLMAAGRLQVYEQGIWAYWGLLPWEQIGDYRWADDGTLLVRAKRRMLPTRNALPVPTECRESLDALLAQHGCIEAEEQGYVGRW